jgi:enoyl-CoA hydratase
MQLSCLEQAYDNESTPQRFTTKQMQHKDIEISKEDGIAILTINRPEKLNALRRAFWRELGESLELLSDDGCTRALILTGAGTRSFSVGGDIAEFSMIEDTETLRELQIECMRGFTAIEQCPLMVIAAVNGYAFGGGCELVLACDWAIAARQAAFALPEASLGLLPGFGAIRAPQLIGPNMTKYLIATGERLSAGRACEAGLVQTVVDADSLLSEARALARKVAQNSPRALRMGKRLVNRELQPASIDHSVEVVTVLHGLPDRREGTRAFLEKRPAKFSAG